VGHRRREVRRVRLRACPQGGERDIRRLGRHGSLGGSGAALLSMGLGERGRSDLAGEN
jgi:hypothetical protein